MPGKLIWLVGPSGSGKDSLLEVLVPICLAVSPPVLRQRLEQRGRENALEIAQRLERAARYKPDNCLTLNNDGSLRQSVDEFFRLLRSHAAREADQLV